MEAKKMQHFTLDDLGVISFPIPQIDGSGDCMISAEKLSESDEKNRNLRENIRKANEEILEQM